MQAKTGKIYRDSFRTEVGLISSPKSQPTAGDERQQPPDQSRIQLRAIFRLGQCRWWSPSKERPRRVSSESRGLAIEGRSADRPNSSQ